MTSKQKLIKICELKAKLIEKHTGITDYFTEADKQDILSWNKQTCNSILTKIKKYGSWSDCYCCPWCMYTDKKDLFCCNCTYKQRHGKCRSKLQKNIYDDILKILRKNSITYICGIPTLKEKIKKILEK